MPKVKSLPPKKWWVKRRKAIRKQYPQRTEKDINKITAGIWHKYSDAVKRKLKKKYYGNPKKRKAKHFWSW